MYSLSSFKIPRYIRHGEILANPQLPVFAGVSEKAFEAVAYIGAIIKDKRITVGLLCAKTRVGPLKQQTLPRMELCAAVMAAQLANRIKMDLNLQNHSVSLWTDSEIILSSINADLHLLKHL